METKTAASSFASWLTDYQQRIEQQLNLSLPHAETEPKTLYTAMRYSVIDAGKRIRPLLVYATGEALGATPSALDPAATAVELIHCYSLVHDDLPAMDDDDFRRGKLSCHKAFDEATAILVGDALLTKSFAVLSQESGTLSYSQQLKMISLLAQASGANGMVAGQALDIAHEGKKASPQTIETMHRLKTGALIKASVQLGALTANCQPQILQQLENFADTIGLAFQIKDDILDAEGTLESLGKTPGIDEKNQKANYLSSTSLPNAKEKTQKLYTSACDLLAEIPADTAHLKSLSKFIIERSR